MAHNRLFQMVYLLLEKGNMTAPALAAHFEVSVRTIYRDIDILSGAGIPVYATPGKGGGIFIQESFILRKSMLSEQEQSHILMALQGIQMVDAEASSELLRKLSGAFQAQNPQWIEVDFSDWRPGDRVRFNQLKSAIFQRRVVGFEYFSGQGAASHREVEPLKLVFKSRDWFLYAYCRLRRDFRLFKLRRIQGLEIHEETFERAAPASVFADEQTFTLPLAKVTLVFDADMAYQVYDHYEHVERLPDGRFQVYVDMPENDTMYSHLLSFGEKAEILAPAKIRTELLRRAQKMIQRYET